MGEILWRLQGGVQLYLTALATEALGSGQGIIASAAVPDLHHFRGSFGGKDVIPLYRDAAGTDPNVTTGLLEALGKEYGTTPTAEDLAAYVYALLGGQRSEEHTSELPSLMRHSYAVFCLKKKTHTHRQTRHDLNS